MVEGKKSGWGEVGKRVEETVVRMEFIIKEEIKCFKRKSILHAMVNFDD